MFIHCQLLPADQIAVKKEIEEENVKAKKVAKSAKVPTDVAQKPKAKQKLVVQTSDSEKTTQPINKARTLKTKPTTTPSVMLVIYSKLVTDAAGHVLAVPIVQAQTEQKTKKLLQ